MDSLMATARQAHRNSVEHVRLAGHFRAQRDRAIRELYTSGEYSYTTLARQVGITRELTIKIVQAGGQREGCDPALPVLRPHRRGAHRQLPLGLPAGAHTCRRSVFSRLP